MSSSYDIGDTVTWQWGNGQAHGTVEEVQTSKTTIHSKGESITRNGSSEDPALIIKNDDGTKILKLQSEVTKG